MTDIFANFFPLSLPFFILFFLEKSSPFKMFFFIKYYYKLLIISY